MQCFFIYVLKGPLKMFLHTAGVKHQLINQIISLINLPSYNMVLQFRDICNYGKVN